MGTGLLGPEGRNIRAAGRIGQVRHMCKFSDQSHRIFIKEWAGTHAPVATDAG